MPPRSGYTIPYPLATRGVDLAHSLVEIAPIRSPYMQNCYYRDGIVQRLGMSFLAETVTTEAAATVEQPILGGDLLVWQGVWPG